MRLRRLDLTRYGKFTDGSLDFGEASAGRPDLHIVYGPNEAGKSTAFAAFLDLLFGIEMQSRYGFLHGYESMRVGGCLEFSDGRRELYRIKKPHPTLRDHANEPVPEGLIQGEMSGLDRSAYKTMFSLDDETIEAGGKSILASNGELGQLLFSASAGLSGLSRALAALRSEADAFRRASGRGDELASLKSALATLKADRDKVDTLAAEHSRLVAARDAATVAYEAAVRQRGDAQGRLAVVERLLSALPRMAALTVIRLRLAALGETPLAPAEWAAELAVLQSDAAGNRLAIELAQANVRRLADECDAAVLDEPALGLAGHLALLGQLKARQVTAELDLPARREELLLASAKVLAIVRRLGRGADVTPESLLLDSAKVSRLGRLIEAKAKIDAATSNAAGELSDALHELAEAKAALVVEGATDTAGDPNVMEALSAAMAGLREGGHQIRRRNAVRVFSQHSERLGERLAGLAPWAGSAEELAKLTVPDSASLRALETGGEKAMASVERLKAEVERLDEQLAVLETGVSVGAGGSGPASLEAVAAARGAREAAWHAHRRALDASTADAFEAALRRDDAMAAARLAQDQEATSLRAAENAISVARAQKTRAAGLLKAAEMEAAGTTEAIVDMLRDVSGMLPADWLPSRLAAWMTLREEALRDNDLARQSARDVLEADEDAGLARQRLAAALRAAAVPFDDGAEVGRLAAIAQSAFDAGRRRAALRLAVQDCERNVRKRQLGSQRATLAGEEWLSAWEAACSGCWLSGIEDARSFEVVRELLPAAAELGPAIEVSYGLAERIRGMEADQAALAAELRRLQEVLWPDQAIALAPLAAAQAVEARISDAQAVNVLRSRLSGELEAARKQLAAATAAASLQAFLGREMMAHYGVGSLADVAARLSGSAEKAGLLDQAGEAERDILARLRASSIDDAQAILAGLIETDLESESAELRGRLEGLARSAEERFAAFKAAEDRLEAVGGGNEVARIEERRRTKLLEVEEKALAYLRLRVGIAAAERALAAYREQHRSSMMAEASEAFSMISKGAYRGLASQPDKDGEVLLAVAREGGSKIASELSKGTRFQLYLALRAAGYLEFAKTRRPVPFIADDIMETFDNHRAEEALRVFMGMAKVGQVRYLSHHPHLCEIARNMSPDIRIHELAV